MSSGPSSCSKPAVLVEDLPQAEKTEEKMEEKEEKKKEEELEKEDEEEKKTENTELPKTEEGGDKDEKPEESRPGFTTRRKLPNCFFVSVRRDPWANMNKPPPAVVLNPAPPPVYPRCAV